MNGVFDIIGIDVGIIVILLIVIVLFLAVLVMKQQLQIDRLNRKYRMFMKGSDGKKKKKMIQRKLNQLDKVQEVNEDQGILLRQMKNIQVSMCIINLRVKMCLEKETLIFIRTMSQSSEFRTAVLKL